MIVLKQGERFIFKIETGEGLLYEGTDSLISPFQFVRTLSEDEVKEHEKNTMETKTS